MSIFNDRPDAFQHKYTLLLTRLTRSSRALCNKRPGIRDKNTGDGARCSLTSLGIKEKKQLDGAFLVQPSVSVNTFEVLLPFSLLVLSPLFLLHASVRMHSNKLHIALLRKPCLTSSRCRGHFFHV